MNKRIFLPAVIFSISLSAVSQPAGKEPLPTNTPNLDIMKIAHRGVKALAPENTLPAAQKAIDLGYDYVEVDVQYSRDGVPVVFHDPILERTTDGIGPMALYKLPELKKLDAGRWFSKEFIGTEIPAFEEMLKLMRGRINLYLDQKQNPRPELVRLIRDYGFYDDLVIVGGPFGRKYLELDPDAPIMPGLKSAEEVEDILARFPSARAFNTGCRTLTSEMVLQAHEQGVMVFTNVLGIPPSYEKECMRRTIELGADAIQVDSPDLLFMLLEEMKIERSGESFVLESDPDVRTDRMCEEASDPEGAPDKVNIHCELEYGNFAPGKEAAGSENKLIHIAAYNMERGMHLDEQIAVFRGHPEFRHADIILIVEADRGCSRTGYRNVARELARALEMNYVYGVEFVELPRSATMPVDNNETSCEHGNAVLSRYPILNAEAIRHSQTRNWYIPPGPERENRQPRLGGRVAIKADIDVGGSLIRVYSVHFDSGANKEESKNRIAQAKELVEHAGGIDRPVVIGGDFNTISYTADVLLGMEGNRAVKSLLDAGFEDAHASLPRAGRGTTGRELGVRGVIDLIFVRGAEVENSGICRPRACGLLSDHLPVWTRIRIE